MIRFLLSDKHKYIAEYFLASVMHQHLIVFTAKNRFVRAPAKKPGRAFRCNLFALPQAPQKGFTLQSLTRIAVHWKICFPCHAERSEASILEWCGDNTDQRRKLSFMHDIA